MELVFISSPRDKLTCQSFTFIANTSESYSQFVGGSNNENTLASIGAIICLVLYTESSQCMCVYSRGMFRWGIHNDIGL